MNFKDWQKLDEDDKTVTLVHPKGHTMKIYSYALPKIQREQMKRLPFAKGGKVKASDALASGEGGMSTQGQMVRHKEKAAKDEARGRAQMERTVKPKMKGLAKGGMAHYADGTEDVSQGDMPDKVEPSGQPPTPPPVTVNVQAPQPAVSQSPPVPVQVPPMPQAPQVNGSSLGNEANKSLQSIEEAKAAQEGQAKLEGAKLQAQIPAQEEAIKSEQQIAQGFQNNRNMINQKTQEFNNWMTQDAQGHPGGMGTINPKHYAESLSTNQKVATAMGLFLGGMGTPFGGHNFAFDHIQKQIDRDIDAQQKSVDNRKTVLGAWQHLYGENNVSLNLAKASMNDIYAKKIQLAGMQVGTAQSMLNAKMGTQKLLQDAEGYRNNAAALATKSGINLSAPPQKKSPGASGSWSGSGADNGSIRSDRILAPGAEKKYQWAMSKFNTVQSPEEKAAIKEEYLNAAQADEALDQIDKLYPELADKTTYGGYLADKVNPAVLGGMAATGAEALGVAGAPVTGGASLLAALPAAAAAGAGGYGAGAALKQGLRAAGGQTQTQYETAANSLESIIGSALKPSGLTPTEIGNIAKDFRPTKFDSDATKKDKLEKLKQKIISVTRKGTIKGLGMTNGNKP